MNHACVILIAAVGILAGASSARADEFDDLRLKWREMLTLGTNASPADPNYAGWIASIGAIAQGHRNTMATEPGRTFLWSDLDQLHNDSSDITATYARIRALAMGHAVRGSSLETNVALRNAIISALDWMYANHYNETKSEFDNWFDWQIGTPLHLNDITVLMYDHLTGPQVTNYMKAVNRFTPTPDLTGANEVWKASVVAVRGVLIKSGARLASARQALSDIFPYVSGGDGFYTDGSFVFHSVFPYNGGYGLQLLQTIVPLMGLLRGSNWEVTDPLQTNVFRWVHESFAPFLYRGALMQMVSGREYSRRGDDHAPGHELMAAILSLAQVAPPVDAAAFRAMVKQGIQADTYRSFLSTQPPPINIWAKELMSDSGLVARGEQIRHDQFPGMDRAVHRRPGWGFGLAMSSSRIGNFESTRGENLRGWYTGEGMTYLYNADLAHYTDGFWPAVDPYRLPGTTVDTRTRANGSGEAYRSPNNWAGGASLQNLYGVSGMQLNAWGSTLAARKSWFMFDNEVVCLGAGISSTDNRPVETIIENRRLTPYGNNPFAVDGVIKSPVAGWSETLTNAAWAHLAGNVPGADIGYFFPQPGPVQARRETRAGSYAQLNSTYGSSTVSTRHFLTLWFDHGLNPSNAAYAYVLLPNQSAAETAAYAATPHIVVLENSSRAQAVRETNLGLTAVNFWRDGTNRVGGITVDRKASVIMQNNGAFLELGVSDPTQTNEGVINLEINVAATAALSLDPGVAVVQLSPTIKLAVNINGAGGKTLRAKLFVGPVETVSVLPAADAFIQNGDQTNANFGTWSYLVVKSGGSSLARESFLRFELPPAPGWLFNASLRLVPITVNDPVYHALALVSDNSWAETGITWNSNPASGAELARWFLPPVGTPVLIPATPWVQEALGAEGRLSFRIYGAGTPVVANSYATYASREHNTAGHRPQMILTYGRVPPTVRLAQPAHEAVFNAPATVTLSAEAQDPDGSVATVEFFSSATALGRFSGALSSVTLSNLAPGAYSFTAVATDHAGLASTSAPVVVTVYNPEPVGSGTGLIGDYHTNQTFAGLGRTRIDPTVNFLWGSIAPDPSLPPDRFSVRWSGRLQARYAGLHLFHTVSDDAVRLWVNGQLLIDNWISHGTTEDTGAISLVPGRYYDIAMEYFDNTGAAVARLYWTPPGGAREIIPQTQLYPATTGLRGEYFSGTNLANLVFTRMDGEVNFSWAEASPDPVLLPGAFSVRWTGKVRARQSGLHAFHTLSDEGVRLWVNNQLIIDNWNAHPASEDSGTIELVQGVFYDLKMEYFESAGDATAVLMWAAPGETRQVIPQGSLTPMQNNNPPSLAAVPDRVVQRGSPVSFTAAAADADQPAQALTYSLDVGAPAGASVDPVNGRFVWNPPAAQAPGSYGVTVRVADNGTPVMTDAQVVRIVVTTNAHETRVTFVPAGAEWRYLDQGVEPGLGWRSHPFNDGLWPRGQAKFGFGTGDEATLLSYGPDAANKFITTFFRHTFYVPDAALVQSLQARLHRNDGAVVYLNGVEVWRDNLPAGDLTSGTLASATIAGRTETNFLAKGLDAGFLVTGTNVVNVEVHLASPNGADASFDFELAGVAVVPWQPALKIVASDTGTMLKWPMEAGLFRLYATPSLTPPIVWMPMTNSPMLINQEWVVLLPHGTDLKRFFRLQTP